MPHRFSAMSPDNIEDEHVLGRAASAYHRDRGLDSLWFSTRRASCAKFIDSIRLRNAVWRTSMTDVPAERIAWRGRAESVGRPARSADLMRDALSENGGPQEAVR